MKTNRLGQSIFRTLVFTTLFTAGCTTFSGTEVTEGESSTIQRSKDISENAPVTGLEITASARRKIVSNEPFNVTIRIKNTTAYDVNLLKWFFEPSDIMNDLFEVNQDGHPVEYIGDLGKRAAPRAEDFVTLGAGEHLERHFDLSRLYDLSKEGLYDITYKFDTARLLGEDADSGSVLSSNKISIYAEPHQMINEGEEEVESAEKKGVGRTIIDRCNKAGENIAWDTISDALWMSRSALLYMKEHTFGPRYNTWYGNPDTIYTRANINIMDRIFETLRTKEITMSCYCKADRKESFAYVNRKDHYVIHLCNAFWNAKQNTGVDSRAGVVIHELSHFDNIGNTNDYAYGQNDCRNLAINDYRQASFNADNIEYYAENDPSLD